MTQDYKGPGTGSLGTYQPDNLVGGGFPLQTATVTIIEGQNLERGAVLGKIPASGKCNLSLAAAVDGSEDVYAILAQDVDATAADKTGLVYLTGQFNDRALTFGAGHTAASTRDAFRVLGIFTKSSVAAG